MAVGFSSWGQLLGDPWNLEPGMRAISAHTSQLVGALADERSLPIRSLSRSFALIVIASACIPQFHGPLRAWWLRVCAVVGGCFKKSCLEGWLKFHLQAQA
eukprot:2889067-Alexandrium_andersonii.AAC.1